MKRRIEAFTEGSFDLCIIGGGITGAGAALDAATRGWRVALIERGDFASGTSSASSKLIHGGLRYLEYGHLRLVHEALIERGRLLRNAPHLVQPLPFVLPFYQGQRVAPWKWRLGLTLYDLLAGRENIARSRRLSIRRVQSVAPPIRSHDLRGGALFYDALMDDARLCLAVLRTASRHGAIVANYVEAVGFEKHQGTIIGVWAEDRLTGQRILIRCRAVLNAAGPGVDAVCRLAGEVGEPRLQPTKGVHLIAPARGHRAACLLLHPRDGRVFFVIPWYGKTLIGTTDTFAEPGPAVLQVLPDEVAYLLEGYNAYFEETLRSDEVMGTFAGLRPLIRARPGEPSSLSREFCIHEAAGGLVTALGGKYTTFRAIAEAIVDRLAAILGESGHCRTVGLRLVGAPKAPWAEFLAEKTAAIAKGFPVDTDSAAHLVRRYGEEVDAVLAKMCDVPDGFARVHPEEPDLIGEQRWQRDEEMAIQPADFFLRRSRIGMWRRDVLSEPEA
ncbi:MAG: glycerol-3-phosphate dehydrogenase [Planctomycetes bacterium]|nr:glycerol-3-phosphate dehydrogenase [Planctomycetota bacterium]